ncbi:MAG: hypothetical protein ACKVJK_18560 [Methylophagaceae bacterium]|jgi:hypothetical protein|tara:strand:- start:929 stop:1261 length:333 start_codon:yes stop_codon:yes gene_type:complete
MANNQSIHDKKFTSDFGYSRDITDNDKPGFVSQNNSALHDTVSLNDFDSVTGAEATPNLYSNTFQVPSANNTLGKNNIPTSTLAKGGNLSSLHGSNPNSVYLDRKGIDLV